MSWRHSLDRRSRTPESLRKIGRMLAIGEARRRSFYSLEGEPGLYSISVEHLYRFQRVLGQFLSDQPELPEGYR